VVTLSALRRVVNVDLVLGTMYFGTRTDQATSYALLDRFVAAGGRMLDTANCYSFWSSATGHGGQSESLLGRWLAANPGLRDEMVIATKVGMEPRDEGGSEGLSAAVIEREAALSLERLGVDVIDLYWAHGEDRGTDLTETVAAFGALVGRGVVRRLGVSNHPTWRVEQARAIAERLGVEPWTALQLTTSYVAPRPGARVPGKDHRFGFVTDETVDYLAEHPDLDLWVYSPLVLGSYDRADRPFPDAYDHPGTTSRLAALNILAADRRVPASQLVLAWLIARGWRPIVGVSSLAQLESALAASRIELTPDELGVLG
jgi:aryl-alcohol dehydrogenase-like predicted oxidoreductase